MKLMLVAGARPNFMKIAPLFHQKRENNIAGLEMSLVHTGQHYDYDMSKVFFDDLDMPVPDYFLNVGSGSHAVQTAAIMKEFEQVCVKEKPQWVVVVGDVNSTLACSITAKKLHINVAHIEAGLRSRDMDMPEEINRVVTDCISDVFFVTEPSGVQNLNDEGKREDAIFFVGNIMIDSLYYCLRKLERGPSGTDKKNPYAVVTLHRPSNVDRPEKLKDIVLALAEISQDIQLVFPIHPRTAKNIDRFGLRSTLANANIRLMNPLSYVKFLSLWRNASFVLTDSGGLQEETTALQIPCFTMRENTERPVTVTTGTNTLVGTTKKKILAAYQNFKAGNNKEGSIPKYWDGKTAERILDIFQQHL